MINRGGGFYFRLLDVGNLRLYDRSMYPDPHRCSAVRRMETRSTGSNPKAGTHPQ
jgi:hypothetical protein